VQNIEIVTVFHSFAAGECSVRSPVYKWTDSWECGPKTGSCYGGIIISQRPRPDISEAKVRAKTNKIDIIQCNLYLKHNLHTPFVPFQIFLSKVSTHFVPKWNNPCKVKVQRTLLSCFIGMLKLDFCELWTVKPFCYVVGHGLDIWQVVSWQLRVICILSYFPKRILYFVLWHS